KSVFFFFFFFFLLFFFLYLKSDEDENLRGQEVRLERSERTLRQQRPAGRATQWRVILYHRPNSETLLNEQG
ncbi:hypothetical protein K792_06261, partial [Salmonella enterica subsp. enterica serovar Newport str. SHSN002]